MTALTVNGAGLNKAVAGEIVDGCLVRFGIKRGAQSIDVIVILPSLAYSKAVMLLVKIQLQFGV